MKKQLIKAMLLLSAPLMVLQSCKDEEETKNTATVELGSATIRGRVTADAILNNGVERDGLAGYTITLTINTDQLVNNGNNGSLNKAYSAITDANGNYSVSIPVNAKPVTVTFSHTADFIGNQVTENKTTRRVRYNNPSVAVPFGSVALANGQTVVRDLHFQNFTDVPANLGLAKVTGIAYFFNNHCDTINGGLDSTVTVPANTILVATWGTSELEVKTDANGKFDFEVETANSQFVTLKGRQFTAARKVNPGSGCVTDPNHDYTHSSISFTVNKNETYRVEKTETVRFK